MSVFNDRCALCGLLPPAHGHTFSAMYVLCTENMDRILSETTSDTDAEDSRSGSSACRVFNGTLIKHSRIFERADKLGMSTIPGRHMSCPASVAKKYDAQNRAPRKTNCLNIQCTDNHITSEE